MSETTAESLGVSNSQLSYRSISFWRFHRYKFWIIGLIIRILVTTFEQTKRDYDVYVLPIATALADGGVLYHDVTYNQMPIIPYLNALAVLIGQDNDILTAMLIKLPSVIADFISIMLLYKIGLKMDKEKTGLISSIIYALNPISLYEISSGRWDVFANMFVLLAFYFLLNDRPILLGVAIGLGFLSKEFPFYFFGAVLVYWLSDFKKIFLSGISFLLTNILIISLILVPTNTSLSSMIDNLLDHPVYSESAETCGLACHSPIQNSIDLVTRVINISPNLIFLIWVIFFLSFVTIPMGLYLKYPSQNALLDLVLIHSTMLSIFFWTMHYQYILWLYPWAIFNSIDKGKKELSIPILLTIAFPFRYREYNLLNTSIPFVPGNIILFITGALILYWTLTEWKSRSINDR